MRVGLSCSNPNKTRDKKNQIVYVDGSGLFLSLFFLIFIFLIINFSKLWLRVILRGWTFPFLCSAFCKQAEQSDSEARQKTRSSNKHTKNSRTNRRLRIENKRTFILINTLILTTSWPCPKAFLLRKPVRTKTNLGTNKSPKWKRCIFTSDRQSPVACGHDRSRGHTHNYPTQNRSSIRQVSPSKTHC